MSYDTDSKRIKGRLKLMEYRKAFREKHPWEGEIPMGEGELNRDGNPKTPPGQRIKLPPDSGSPRTGRFWTLGFSPSSTKPRGT